MPPTANSALTRAGRMERLSPRSALTGRPCFILHSWAELQPGPPLTPFKSATITARASRGFGRQRLGGGHHRLEQLPRHRQCIRTCLHAARNARDGPLRPCESGCVSGATQPHGDDGALRHVVNGTQGSIGGPLIALDGAGDIYVAGRYTISSPARVRPVSHYGYRVSDGPEHRAGNQLPSFRH